ncbi:hypothetical protein [Porphyromonas gingivicanis]|uniref:hypothetical protein n=1 Tax=Porphyromonas gingivicanis TaxID=266762 RepID=UPI00047155AB|nr:hypothetical protein [Porphyromonas gingivicanis]
MNIRGVAMLNIARYQSLQKDIRDLYVEFEALKEYKECLTKEYSQVKVFLEEIKINHDFPQLNIELNSLIQNFSEFETPNLLLPKLKEHIENIRIIDSGIDDLSAKYDILKHVPNRNSWLDTIEKIRSFLDKLPSLSLQNLEYVANTLLPQAFNAISSLEQAVNTEKNQWFALQQDALDFKALLSSHKNTIDRYNFAQAYEAAIHFVDRLLAAPDMINLDSEAQELLFHKNEINHCLEQFQIELNEIQNYSPDWGRVWRDDALRIKNLQNQICQDIYTSPSRLSEIGGEVSVAIKRKYSDIKDAITLFKENTRTHFQSEIQSLETTCCPSDELNLLIKKMTQYESLVRRQRYITIVKWIAGSVGVSLLFYGIYKLAKAYPIPFGIGVVVLIFIAYKFYSKYR